VRFSCELLQVFETRPTISQDFWCALRRWDDDGLTDRASATYRSC
jgi:hypothetical protein